ncbi:hypothetical protein GOBAR_DD11764 [Gossypium barbadense]|nr:hypothetical protein GOBAR_DD11764 [Gossypium barbadense]
MVLFPTINEACRVLDEGVVARASALDVASVLGMSFPFYCGGIMFGADTVGSKHIYLSLKKWSERYGSYFKPSRYLEERAMKGMPLSKSDESKKSYMQECAKVVVFAFKIVEALCACVTCTLVKCIGSSQIQNNDGPRSERKGEGRNGFAMPDSFVKTVGELWKVLNSVQGVYAATGIGSVEKGIVS